MKTPKIGRQDLRQFSRRRIAPNYNRQKTKSGYQRARINAASPRLIERQQIHRLNLEPSEAPNVSHFYSNLV
jgi:hypothetical protein